MTVDWTEVATPTRTVIACRWFPMATQQQVITSQNLICSHHVGLSQRGDILTDEMKIWIYYVIIITNINHTIPNEPKINPTRTNH